MNIAPMIDDAQRHAQAATGRVALITGAARGLGLAIASELGRAGHPVVLLDSTEGVAHSAARLRAAGADARALRLNIADEAAVRELPARLRALGPHWDRLSIVVNNAGISPKTNGVKRTIAEMSASEWHEVIAVNLTGTFLVTQTCLPALCARGWGRVVMITSQAARTRTPVPGAHYAASKAGITGFARVLAGEIAAHGVTVNCVAPGRIASDMTDAVDPALNAKLAEIIPVGRLGRAEEVAAAVAVLVSEGATYQTRANIDNKSG
ncbi:MAG: SDR family NAD(P)-dependent oxidoreductase, partial [Variovorax sp.]